MRAYCKILDEETGLVQKGEGCPDEYYLEIGMEIRDIKQSDLDCQWYLTEKCPMKPPITPADREEQFNKEFFNTSLGYVRRKYTNKNGEVKDFLSDALPTLSIALNSGTAGQIYVYDEPSFDQDVEDWTIYQHKVSITPEFISDCFTQTNKDFFGI